MLIWPFIYLWRNVFSDFAHFLIGQIEKLLIVEFKSSSYILYDLQKYSLILWVLFLWCSLKIFNFHEVQFICFSLLLLVLLLSYLKRLCPVQGSQRFTPIFSPRSFLVLVISCQCLICFEFNFVYEKKMCVWCEEGVQLHSEHCCEVSKTSLKVPCRRLAFYVWMPVGFFLFCFVLHEGNLINILTLFDLTLDLHVTFTRAGTIFFSL